MFKKRIKTFLKLQRNRKPRRTSSNTPLIENDNNNYIPDGHDLAGNGLNNTLDQETVNSHEEQRVQDAEVIEQLAKLLGVAPDANASEDGSCSSMRPEPSSGQQSVVRLIQSSVSQHFPKQPADLNQSLQPHLVNVQETVRNELVRLGPQIGMQLMSLIDLYHRHTFDHLNDLLCNISSSHNSLVLMKWVLHVYLSQELLGHPDLQKKDPVKQIDLLLLTDWVEKAKDKLLENVQKEIRGLLEKILQNEINQEGCDCEEDYVRLYMDTIQCIEAMPREAQNISVKLSDHVREVCFQELLMFLERFTDEQREILKKKAKMDKPETMHFFKTLNTCKELKQYVLTQGKGIKRSLLQETVATLENMEAFTLKLLTGLVADIAEIHLKNYFRTNKSFFDLIHTVKMWFPRLSCQEIQKRVMDEVYKLITGIYLKHLVRSSQSKLKKCWNPDVGQTVAEDAELLHETFSDLAPGVLQWNLILLKIKDLLDCDDIDTLKIIVASMQKDCLTSSDDLKRLLRWKDLSGRQVKEVLNALPDQNPRPGSVSWYSCLTCW